MKQILTLVLLAISFTVFGQDTTWTGTPTSMTAYAYKFKRVQVDSSAKFIKPVLFRDTVYMNKSLAAGDSSTKVPNSAWVKRAVASGSGTLQTVTDNGNETTNDLLVKNLSNGNEGILKPDTLVLSKATVRSNLTSRALLVRNWVLPDSSGTVALLSNVDAKLNISDTSAMLERYLDTLQSHNDRIIALGTGGGGGSQSVYPYNLMIKTNGAPSGILADSTAFITAFITDNPLMTVERYTITQYDVADFRIYIQAKYFNQIYALAFVANGEIVGFYDLGAGIDSIGSAAFGLAGAFVEGYFPAVKFYEDATTFDGTPTPHIVSLISHAGLDAMEAANPGTIDILSNRFTTLTQVLANSSTTTLANDVEVTGAYTTSIKTSVAHSYTAVTTSTYSIVPGDYVISIDMGGSACTVTLPDGGTLPTGTIYTIKRYDDTSTGTYTIDVAGGGLVQGTDGQLLGSTTLSAWGSNGDKMTFQNNGNNQWELIR